jgi:predicted transposase/invertase (TIGR01784 family)
MANLIRFDWAVKKLLRDKANFGVLEGFLTELLGFGVTIQQILESESNKRHKVDKFNRVDMLVRTDQDELMLIEIQNDAETDYFHRILYGASKLVTEYVKEGEGYLSVKKIISISIVYFRLGQGSDYIYEYEGKFVGRHLKDTLYPNARQKNRFSIKEVADIFPKYYILRINNFNNIAKDNLDEWIYFLKNSEILSTFKAKGLKEAAEKLQIDQLPEEERKAYERYRESRWIEKDVVETAFSRGEEQLQIHAATKLIEIGQSNEMIREVTKLTIEQIEDLRSGKYISNFSENSNEIGNSTPKKRKKL